MEDSVDSLEDVFRLGRAEELAEEYVVSCNEALADTSETGKGTRKKKGRFPNLAGFCRYVGVRDADLSSIKLKYPREFDRIRMILEDEALNSDVSPTILAAYLKKRLGYEKTDSSEIYDGQLKIVFEHDIMEDGE